MGMPFIGPAGFELDQQLRLAGILRYESLITNVFADRPANNNLDAFCYPKGTKRPSGYDLSPVSTGKYVELDRGYEALSRLKTELLCQGAPNLILAMGNTALWALTSRTGIRGLRGTLLTSNLIPGAKVLPTYHPAAVLRDFSLRPILTADLFKARREMEFPEIRRPARTIYIAESLNDLYSFDLKGPKLSFDIETKPAMRLLDCIGLSGDPSYALVIPFLDQTKPDWSYWSEEDEPKVWRWLKTVLESPRPKVAQNGVYDYIWLKAHKISVQNWTCDTMLAHHALFPELPKSLDFLGSIYTEEVAWKLDRPRGNKTGKREE